MKESTKRGAPLMKESTKKHLIESLVFVCLLELGSLWYITQKHSKGQMVNVIISVAVAVVVEIGAFHLINSIDRRRIHRVGRETQLSYHIYSLFTCVIVCAGIVATLNRMQTEKNTMVENYGNTSLVWNRIPLFGVFLLGLFSMFVFAVLMIKEQNSKTNTFDRIVTYSIYLFSIVLYGVFCYTPNVLNNDVHHVTAAYTSIYNVAFDVPYNVRTSGIYGHYAIFFWPFLKILGHKPQTVGVLVAFAGLLAELLIVYALDKTVKSETVKRAASLASCLPIVSVYFRSYPQTYPLRIIPAAIILAYGAYYASGRGTIKKAVIGYVLCAVSITWAFDAGLVSTIAFSAMICSKFWQEYDFFSVPMMKIYVGCIAGCLGSVVGMIALINLYNVLICRSAPVFRACFFPFMGGGSFAESLQLPLRFMNLSWIWCLILFFISSVVGLISTKFFCNVQIGVPKDTQLALFFFAVMGLGQAGYYFNRAAYYNLTVIMTEAALCMAILIDQVKIEKPARSFSQSFTKGVGYIFVFELSMLSLATILTCGASLENRMDAGFYDMTNILDLSVQVQEKIPKDTYAVGYGTQEVYAQLGWNPGYLQRDVSDMFGDGIEEICEEINSQNTILLGKMYLEGIFNEDAGWILRAQIPEENPVFLYYVKQ